LDGLFAEARRAGYVRATLWTASDNDRARRLYAGSGMHPTGRTKTLASYGTVIQFGVELSDAARLRGLQIPQCGARCTPL
jgi:hypothetical protein